MNDNRHAHRKKKNIIRQLTRLGLFMPLVLLATLFVVPRFIVVSTEVTSPAPNTFDHRNQPTGSATVRGIIYDRNGNEMAVNYNTSTISAHPLEMENVALTAEKLADILGLEPDGLAASLKAERSIVRLGRNIAPDKARQVADLHLQGVYVAEEPGRFYPQHQIGAHIVGYAENGHGLNGVEFRYNDLLQKGFNSGSSDVTPVTRGETGAGQGAHLALTIDLRIQTMLEDQLQALLKKTGAESGSALIIDPRNGAILALANQPSFDPNSFTKASDNSHVNRAQDVPMTLGSIGGLFQLGASLEKEAENRVTPPTIVEDPNAMLIAPLPHKRPIAIAKLDLDDARLRSFASRLGLSAPVADETAPVAAVPDGRADSADSPVPFRLDSSFQATALELAAAFCGLINGGHRITPQLLATAYDPSIGREKQFLQEHAASDLNVDQGKQLDVSQELLEIISKIGRPGPSDSLFVESITPETPTQPIRPHSATQLADIIQQNTQESDRVRAMLMGFAPSTAPEIVMAVTLNQAEGKTFKKCQRQTSPLLAMGGQSIVQAKKMADSTTEIATAELWKKTEETPLKHWKIEPQLATAAATANELRTIQMPDVVGKSLRSGLQVLQHYDLRIRVVGSGRIVNQHPLPKTALLNGDECILQLNLDH